MTNPKKLAISVLGMHRSGTSSVAGGVSVWGASLPKNVMNPTIDNPKGYFESTAIMSFNNSLMAKIGTAWDDWRPITDNWINSPIGQSELNTATQILDQEFEGAPFIVIKDPRFCRLGAFWKHALINANYETKYIFVFRNPIEVAESLKSRDGMSISEGLLLWLRYNIDAEITTRFESRGILDWKEYIEDPSHNLQEMAENINIIWPKFSDHTNFELEKFVSKKLHRQISKNVTKRKIGKWVFDAYSSLQELRSNPNSNSAIETLDRIKRELDSSSELFGRYFVDVKNQEAEHRNALLQSQEHGSQLEAARAELDTEAARLRDGLAASEVQASQINLEREQLAAQLVDHRDALHQSREHASQLESARAELDAEATRLRDALAASEHQASQINLEREQLAAQLADHREALLQSQEHGSQLEAARAELDGEATRLRDALTASEHQASEVNLEREQLAAQLADHRDALLQSQEHGSQLEAARAELDAEIVRINAANAIEAEFLKSEYNKYMNINESDLKMKNSEIENLKDQMKNIRNILNQKTFLGEIFLSQKLEKIRRALDV